MSTTLIVILIVVVLAVGLAVLGIGLSRWAPNWTLKKSVDKFVADDEIPTTTKRQRRGQQRPPKVVPPSLAPKTAPVPDDVVLEEVVVDEVVVEVADDGTVVVEETIVDAVVEVDADAEVDEAPKLRDRMGRTRTGFARTIATLRGRGALDDAAWDELEETLLLADVGVPTTTKVLDGLRERVKRDKVRDADGLVTALHAELVDLLEVNGDRTLHLTDGEPNVWMFVGVNGVGKTTSIAKVAERQINEHDRTVVLAAGDTFRAAAAEQLAHWAERTGAGIVRGQEGADPGSIVFDAMSAAAGREADLVLVDTAGRLHTKVNLMAELEKLRRIVERTPGALKEVLLVLDATTGQNGLTQARQFAEAVAVTGVVLTKLDGSAKGGIVLAIESELGIPVKLIGVGESAADLLDFDPEAFVAALLD